MPRSTVDFGLHHLEPRALPAVITWDGGAGTMSWHDAANWSADTLPGPADDVTINIPGTTPPITHAQAVGTAVRSLVCNEFFSLTAGTLSVATQWKQNAPMTMSGGVVGGTGNLIINAGFTWTAGTLVGAGKVQVLSTGNVTIAAAPSVTLARDLVNNGTIRWTAGNIRFADATITNLAGRTFNAQAAGTLVAFSGVNLFDNKGILRRNGTSATASLVNIPVNSTGIVDAKQGQLVLNAGGTASAGTMSAQPGATLKFGGVGVATGYTLGANAAFTGGGTFSFHTVPHKLFGAFTAPVGQLYVNTPSLLMQGPARVLQTIVLVSGELELTGTLDIQTMAWTGGELSGGGLVRVGAGGTLSITGASVKVLAATLRNEGAGVWSGGQWQFVNGRFENAGTFDAHASSITSFGGSTNVVVNTGVFTKRAGASTLAFDTVAFAEMRLVNLATGTVRIEGGVLKLMGGGSSAGQVFRTGAQASLEAGGRAFSVTGGAVSAPFAVIGPVTWSGGSLGGVQAVQVRSGGTLTIAGAGGKTLLSNLVINDGGDGVWSAVLSATGVSIINAGDLEVRAGAGAAGGDLLLTNQSRLTKRGVGLASFVSSPLRLNNTGEVVVEQGTLRFAASQVQQIAGSTLTGGTWDVRSFAALEFQGAQILVNDAEVTLHNTAFLPFATLRQNNGTIKLTSGCNVVVTPAGGTLTNTGTFSVEQDSQVSVLGALTLTSTSRVSVQVAGMPHTTGRVFADGHVSLAGVISAGFSTPVAIGQAFTFLTALSIGGQFQGEFYALFQSGVDVEIEYLGSSARFIIIPE